jgi:hypothetical protein
MENKKLIKNGNVNKVQTATDGWTFGAVTKELGTEKRAKDSGNFDVSNKRISSTERVSIYTGTQYGGAGTFIKRTRYKYAKTGQHSGQLGDQIKKAGSGGWIGTSDPSYANYLAAWNAGTKNAIKEMYTDKFLGKKLSAVLADTQTYTLKSTLSNYHGDGSEIVE